MIARYLNGESLSVRDVLILRTYLRQWVDSTAWDDNPYLNNRGRLLLSELRFQAQHADTPQRIDACIRAAIEMGMDPL